MVPIALLVWLSTEIAIYLTAARQLFDAPWDAAILGALLALLTVRGVIVAVTWAYARAYPSPAPPLSASQRLRMVVAEYLAFLLSFIVVMPFEWADHRDCHVKPDLVLIYRKPDEETLELVRLGSHSELGL